MKTFVVPDIHGRYESLRSLLLSAGVINEDDRRTDEAEWDAMVADGADPQTLDQRCFRVVSIGDLANAVQMDVNGDEQCLQKVADWFDYLILGNHESGYLFDGMSFNGYYPAPHLKSLYNGLYRRGFVKPAVLVGETLLTHAGVHEYYDFGDAAEAFDAIFDVWENYREYSEDYGEKFYFGQNVEIPKALLLDGVSSKRGGNVPMGGILWADWHESKNTRFSQVMGHTPIKQGPVLTTYQSSGVFTLNIDCAAKKGLTPWGVWLDEYGLVEELVTVPAPELVEA